MQIGNQMQICILEMSFFLFKIIHVAFKNFFCFQASIFSIYWYIMYLPKTIKDKIWQRHQSSPVPLGGHK